MQLLILLSAPLLAVLEFVLIFGLEIAHTPRTAAWLRRLCLAVLWLFTALCTGSLLVCCMAALDYAMHGQVGTAVRLFLTAVLLAACIYAICLRYYLRKLFPPRPKR